MQKRRETKYWIVKHDLDSFDALPGFIWRRDKGANDKPQRFDQVHEGDRWIAFAYTSDDDRQYSLRIVKGFYQCSKPALHQKIPRRGLKVSYGERWAWIIEGKEYGTQPSKLGVGVPPLADFIGNTFHNQALTPIKREQFENIREHVLKNPFDPRKIPLLGREPENEQELLAVVVFFHKKLGIEKILHVGKAFPDMLVKLNGHRQPIHLELELYSSGFCSHGHDKHVRNCNYTDGQAVAVLCWIHNCKRVPPPVHRVYELRSQIRDGETICW